MKSNEQSGIVFLLNRKNCASILCKIACNSCINTNTRNHTCPVHCLQKPLIYKWQLYARSKAKFLWARYFFSCAWPPCTRTLHTSVLSDTIPKTQTCRNLTKLAQTWLCGRKLTGYILYNMYVIQFIMYWLWSAIL